jgi:hypothetical protein
MAGKVVYSVTGQEVNLKEASVESLAEVVDGMNEEMSRLQEARQLVMRELARRLPPSGFEHVGEWQLSTRPHVHVVRKRTEA